MNVLIVSFMKMQSLLQVLAVGRGNCGPYNTLSFDISLYSPFKRRLKLVQSLFCMVFFGGLTVTSHHFLFKNVFKVDFLLTVNDYNYKWVKKNYLRKKI